MVIMVFMAVDKDKNEWSVINEFLMKGGVLDFLKERNIPYQVDFHDRSIVHIILQFDSAIHIRFTHFIFEHLQVGYSVKGAPTSFFIVWQGDMNVPTRPDTKQIRMQEACSTIEDLIVMNDSVWPPILSNTVVLLHCLQTKGIIRDVRRLMVQTYLDAACKSARAELRRQGEMKRVR